jgi:hypothetical protein
VQQARRLHAGEGRRNAFKPDVRIARFLSGFDQEAKALARKAASARLTR